MTATLSVEAAQARLMLLLEVAVATNEAGTEGGVVSGVVCASVVAVLAALAGDKLPAASMALTVYEYVVDGVRPVSLKLVPKGEPTKVVPR